MDANFWHSGRDIPAIERNRAGIRCCHAREQLKQASLTSPVSSQKSNDFILANMDRYAGQDLISADCIANPICRKTDQSSARPPGCPNSRSRHVILDCGLSHLKHRGWRAAQ